MIEITEKDIAEMFDYKNPESFRRSSAKKRILRGCELLLAKVGEDLPNAIKWKAKK